MSTEQTAPDPLAQITLAPRTFAAVLATAGVLVGLILALVPVHVAGLSANSTVSCGNVIGGVETASVTANLPAGDRATEVSYLGTCEQALDSRATTSELLFFAGVIGIVWLGVVRRTG